MALPVDRRHRLAQRRLAETTAAQLAALIAALPEPRDQSAMDSYNRAATPLVAGGQRLSATLALGYMATLAAPRQVPSLDRALKEVLVDSESAATRSPILRLWALLDEGQALVEAAAAASSYAEQLASNDLQVAERAGLEEGADVSGQRIVGWRKELDPEACDWCVLVGEERIYRSAESVPFHERDRCSVAPVLEGEE